MTRSRCAKTPCACCSRAARCSSSATNRRALLARALGVKSPIFDIEHLQLFSPQSVRALLSRAGFSRVEVHTVVNRYPINYWARLSPIPRSLKPRALALLRSSGLGRFSLAAPVGNLAAIAYK